MTAGFLPSRRSVAGVVPFPLLIALAYGKLAGGDSVTITGAHLSGASSVAIGGVACTSVVVVNDTTITCVVPAGTAGAKDLVVTTPFGVGTLVGGYTYQAAPDLSGASLDVALNCFAITQHCPHTSSLACCLFNFPSAPTKREAPPQ